MHSSINKLVNFQTIARRFSYRSSIRSTILSTLRSTILALIITLLGSTMVQAAITSNKAENNNTPLIPRSMIFSDPERISAKLSHDGKWISYMAPHNGVLNIWVGDAKNASTMRPITDHKKRGIAGYLWSFTNNHIVYIDDNEGNEDWRVYRVDVNSGEKLTLASFKNVKAQFLGQSHRHPEEILIGLNQRRSDLHDVYRLNVVSGKMELVLENNNYAAFVLDDDLNLKVGIETTEDGGMRYFALNKDKSNDKAYVRDELFTVPQAEVFNTNPLLISKNGATLYMLDSRGRDKAALTAVDLKTKQIKMIAESETADIGGVMTHPIEHNIEAYHSTYQRTEWKILDKSIEADFNYLKNLAEGELHVADRTLDNKTWIVAYFRDDGPPLYYSYDRTAKKAQFLFSSRPDLDKMPLSKMDPVIIKSRDNLSLVSYLTLPKDVRIGSAKAKHPVPLILNVHGGPALRDEWGYDPEHQWLANRGYAVLSVNYRGSLGFGKKFVNAGNGEWAAKMHNDLLDAVQWAIDQGITSKDKVCIYGGSYGGYATLVGLTMTPETFACGVDIVGMSNLETMMRTIPPYWKPLYALFKVMVGADPETEAGREFLAARSPLTHVQNIKKPLLIGQGANDPRVKQAESDQIVSAMQTRKIPVTYILYPDEGHGFQRPENRMSFYAVTEAFLAKHLGGRFEPIKDDFKNSSIEIKVGKEHLEGI